MREGFVQAKKAGDVVLVVYSKRFEDTLVMHSSNA